MVRVREWDNDGAVTTLRVDARTHAVKLSRVDRFLLRGLEPDTHYDVVLRDTAESARTRGFDAVPSKSGPSTARAAAMPSAAPC